MPNPPGPGGDDCACGLLSRLHIELRAPNAWRQTWDSGWRLSDECCIRGSCAAGNGDVLNPRSVTLGFASTFLALTLIMRRWTADCLCAPFLHSAARLSS